MKLAYLAYDQQGRRWSDVIDSPTETEASEELSRRGLFVAEMRPAEAAAVQTKSNRHLWPSRTRRLKNLTTFTKQLYMLISSGTPVVESLEAIELQVEDGLFAEILADVRRRVAEGSSLSEALDAHPEYFDSVFRSMVAAGESGGIIAEMLDRLNLMVKKQFQVRRTVIGALTYPCLLMVLAVSVLCLLLVFVIPRFADLFNTLGVPLPPTTRVMIFLSDVMRLWWWLVLICLAAGAAGLKMFMGSDRGKRTLDTIMIRLPKIGVITRNLITARITRLFGAMLEGHVPIIEAIRLVRNGTGNCHYADMLDQAEQAVIRGEAASDAFANPALISPSVTAAMHSGERSGNLGPLLLTVSDFLDEENDALLRTLTSIIEPVILVVLGLVVGVVAVSLFMPLFDLTAVTGGAA